MNIESYISNIQKIEDKNLFKILDSDFKLLQDFETKYISIRANEDRILNNDEILALPKCNKSKQLNAEWELRAQSFKQLEKFMKLNNVQNVLDIGCGNGWLFNCIQDIVKTYTGIETNLLELKQANLLFKEDNVHWLYGDIYKLKTTAPIFDLIIFNASFQYFESANIVLTFLLKNFLSYNGKIIIMDSPFYKSENGAKAAKLRSQIHFESVNQTIPEYYYHHTFEDIKSFKLKVYNDKLWLKKIKKYSFNIPYNPFPFIVISK